MSARNKPHKIIQSLGKKKCNGSWEKQRKTHNGSGKEIADEQKDRLTGATLTLGAGKSWEHAYQ